MKGSYEFYYRDRKGVVGQIFRCLLIAVVRVLVGVACDCIVSLFAPIDLFTDRGKIWRIRHLTRFKLWCHDHIRWFTEYADIDGYLKHLSLRVQKENS